MKTKCGIMLFFYKLLSPLLSVLCFIASLGWVHPPANASSLFEQEGVCIENAEHTSLCDEKTANSHSTLPSPSSSQDNISRSLSNNPEQHKNVPPQDKTFSPVHQPGNITIYFLWGDGWTSRNGWKD